MTPLQYSPVAAPFGMSHTTLKMVLMAALVVLLILVIFHQVRKRRNAKGFHHHKNHFHNKVGVRKHNNLNTGGMNSHWWHGGGDAGHGGSTHREETAIHKAIYAPHLYREHLVTNPLATECQPGETKVPITFPPHQVQVGYDETKLPDGTMKGTPIYATVPGGTTYNCVAQGSRPDAGTGLGDDDGLGSDPDGSTYKGRGGCPPWDPEATAEVQALGQVGGFQNDNAYGERRLQRAFGLHITDEQLNTIMHQ